MRQISYSHSVLPPSFIADNPTRAGSQVNPDQTGWTDEEIAEIRAVLKRLTAVRIYNSSDAEDLVQETLLTMISKLPETVLEKGPLVWALGILRKKVGNYYRKARRHTALSEQDAGTRACMRVVSPDTSLFREELRNIVGEVVDQLPLPQRQALKLMIAGFDAGEIARLLQPERYQNVINSLYRGRKKLARELAKHGYVPNTAGCLGKMKVSRGRRRAKEEQNKALK